MYAVKYEQKLSMKSQSNENDNTGIFFNYKFLCVKLWLTRIKKIWWGPSDWKFKLK